MGLSNFMASVRSVQSSQHSFFAQRDWHMEIAAGHILAKSTVLGKVQLNIKKLTEKRIQLLEEVYWKKNAQVKRRVDASSLLIDLLRKLTEATPKGKEEPI